VSVRAADLVIVGGGILGAATAFFASRAGLRSILVERRAGLATLTTTRSLEGVRAQFDEPEDIAMMRESLEIFERFPDVVGLKDASISFRQQGYLFVSRSEAGAAQLARRVALQHAAGLADVELLDAAELRRRFAYLAPDVRAGAFRQKDGWVASHEASYGFVRGAGDRATLLLETEVLGFERQAGRLAAVLTSRGRLETPRAIVCAGPFSGEVARLAGIELPFFALRRHRGGIKAHDRIPRGAPMTVDFDTGAHWRPEGPGAWIGWSGALDESPQPPAEQVAADWTFPALVLDALCATCPFWGEIAETLGRSNVTVEAGQYDMTPDAKPLIGESELPGLYLNTGYSGHGVMGSPGGSRLAVDLMLGQADAATNPFRASRFREGQVAAKKPL
jgi:sarcosine oxidase subunit beta